MEEYKGKCMKNLSKQVTSVMIYTIKNLINQLCKKDSQRVRELLQAAKCANKATQEFNKCNSNYIDVLLGAKNEENEKMRVPQLCWSVKTFFAFNFCIKRHFKIMKTK